METTPTNEPNQQPAITPLPPAQPKREHTWALFCHLSALAMFIGIPFGNIIGPLIIWLIKKDEMPLVDRHGRDSLNFQMSMTIYMLIALALCFVLIGFLFIFPIVIANLVFIIIASIKASNDEPYEYPLSIKFLK